MSISLYSLLWLYIVYSFAGWCIEVSAAVISKRKFINRGFVSGPLCPIYGAGAVLYAVFLPELKSAPFFLFLGGMILASVLEFSTGKILEKIFKKKWWDYSHHRFSFDGYICLRYSVLWGLFALLLLYVTNPALLYLLSLLPSTLGHILLLFLCYILVLDFTATWIALKGMQKEAKQLSSFRKGMVHASRLLENEITRRLQKRMRKAFPSLSEEPLVLPDKEKTTVFAEGCSFYKLTSIFFIGAFLGDLTETIFCYFTVGRLMSRSSVVYGPFSIVWGLGCTVFTALLYRYKDKPDRQIFMIGTLLGGAYEYICSVVTEILFGTIFWDYSGFAFNLGGRVNLLYCFFWGIAAVIWLKLLYPRLSRLVEKLPKKPGIIISNIMIVFMIVNVIISCFALARYTERNTLHTPASNAVDRILDERFPNERMERIYPNAKIVT